VSDYKNILVAVDLSKELDKVLEKAVDIATKYDSRIWLIHVVEPIILDANADFAPSFDMDIEKDLVARAEKTLMPTVDKLEIDCSVTVLVGSIKREIHTQAKEKNCSLIIIGTHGRHGMARLLGSTASAVLHGAPCDVLTVKIY